MIPYGPHWYAAVMGTGIVAVAATGLPFDVPGAADLAVLFWLLAIAVLAVVVRTTVRHCRRDPGLLRRHLDDPVMSHFYGAPAMALLTVGAATMTAGSRVIGGHAALSVDAVLWPAGTLVGLLTAVAVPYRAITTHEVGDDSANGSWFMPVVPPMVSAATGPLLIPHLPAGQAQETLLLGCYACFGLTLVAGLLMLTSLWQRLVRWGVGAPATVPTVWIALGFLGQSITAAHHLGAVAPTVLPAYGAAFHALTLVYGVPMWGFAMLWTMLAAALTLRTARRGLPFALTWWSFTFPVGTLVTGTSALAAATGLAILDVLALALFLALLGAWSLVAGRTLAALLTPVSPVSPVSPAVGAAPR